MQHERSVNEVYNVFICLSKSRNFWLMTIGSTMYTFITYSTGETESHKKLYRLLHEQERNWTSFLPS